MKVAIGDLRNVIKAARKGGNRVVLGGHSLGGSITVAYATWDFNGHAGADDLAGLVLIDGGSGGVPVTRAEAKKQLRDLDATSPFIDLTGLGLPWSAGVFNIVGSTLARLDPDAPSRRGRLAGAARQPEGAGRGHQRRRLRLRVRRRDLTREPAPRPHAHRLARPQPAIRARGWTASSGRSSGRRRCSPGSRASTAPSWYHPRRLSLDSQAVAGGIANPAQRLLGVRATHGRDLDLPIYAIETSLGAGRVLRGARALARKSHIAGRRLTLVDRHTTYDHLDPLGALAPKNAFLKTVIPFLRRAG